MQTTFCGKRISSILGVLPEQEFFFEDEVGNYAFPEKQTLRLKRAMKNTGFPNRNQRLPILHITVSGI